MTDTDHPIPVSTTPQVRWAGIVINPTPGVNDKTVVALSGEPDAALVLSADERRRLAAAMAEADRPDLDAIAAREQAASKEVARLCNGGRWEMQVPARDDADSDMVISRSLSDIDVLLEEVRRLTAELETARRQERERCARALEERAARVDAQVANIHRFAAELIIRALPDEDTPTTEET